MEPDLAHDPADDPSFRAGATNSGSATSSRACSSLRDNRGQKGWIWGVGPVLLLPTATEELLGADQWGTGPAGVVLKQQGLWTYGVLANHIDSAGGDDEQPVDSTFLQPFLSRTNGSVTYSLNLEATYDHEAYEWTAPLHLTISEVARIGSQRLSLAAA